MLPNCPRSANRNCALARTLIEQVHSQQRELDWRQAKIDKLTHGLALHKRWRFGVRTEELSAQQARLFEEAVEADLAAIERELEQLSSAAKPADKAQPRRRFFDLHANRRSQIAGEALELFGQLYGVERTIAEFDAEQRLRIRQTKARPIADVLHAWLRTQRPQVPEGSAIAKAIDYSLNRWAALIRYLDDGLLPIDNNWLENRIRPVALGRANWLFAGILRAGQRAAAIMSLIQSAKLNGHDPYAYLKDVLERLPTQPASRIGELLPHRGQSGAVAS